MATQTQATIEDLYRVDGKAEIVDGELVLMPPTGDDPSRAGGSVYTSLREYERQSGIGRAYPDNAAFGEGGDFVRQNSTIRFAFIQSDLCSRSEFLAAGIRKLLGA